jgi:hypothetical protein
MSEFETQAGPEQLGRFNDSRKALFAELKDIIFGMIASLTDETRNCPKSPRAITDSALNVNRYIAEHNVKVASVCERLGRLDLDEMEALAEALDYYRRNGRDIEF